MTNTKHQSQPIPLLRSRSKKLVSRGEEVEDGEKIVGGVAEDYDPAVQLVSMLRTTENKIYRQGVSDPKELADGFPTRAEELFAYQAGGDAPYDYLLDGDLLDLEPALRDALVLELPLSPLCSLDCPGLCGQCGVRLADAGAGHGHATDGAA